MDNSNDSQSDMEDTEHEIALENNECDTQHEMRKCEESGDECLEKVSSSHGVVAMNSLFGHSSFDDNVDNSADATIIDMKQLDTDDLTYPDPINWTFSKDVPNVSFIDFDTIGMETGPIPYIVKHCSICIFLYRVQSYSVSGLFCRQRNIIFSFVLPR